MVPVLDPTGLFSLADTQCGLRDNSMGEKGIRRVNAAQARITYQSLVTRRAKDSVAARHTSSPRSTTRQEPFTARYLAAKIFEGHCAP
jgi:hypothetical protein